MDFGLAKWRGQTEGKLRTTTAYETIKMTLKFNCLVTGSGTIAVGRSIPVAIPEVSTIPGMCNYTKKKV